MSKLTRPIAITVAVLGLVIMVVGAVNWLRATEGLASLDAVYQAQGVELSYDEQGRLLDRGTPEGAQAIMTLLEDDYRFPVDHGDLDPADPLVDTPTELMFQFATITYHVLHGTQTVTLTEDVEYQGEVFSAGTYEVPVDGRYWTDFDRMHPLEGPAREMAWSGTVHGLLAELSTGVAADYQAGFAHFAAWRTLLVGFAVALGGVGLFTVTGRRRDTGQDAETDIDLRIEEFVGA